MSIAKLPAFFPKHFKYGKELNPYKINNQSEDENHDCRRNEFTYEYSSRKGKGVVDSKPFLPVVTNRKAFMEQVNSKCQRRK